MKTLKATLKILAVATFTALMCGCVSFGKFPDPFPVEPEWRELTKPPVVAKTNDHFIITDELMELSTQQKYWLDKIRQWKSENEID